MSEIRWQVDSWIEGRLRRITIDESMKRELKKILEWWYSSFDSDKGDWIWKGLYLVTQDWIRIEEIESGKYLFFSFESWIGTLFTSDLSEIIFKLLKSIQTGYWINIQNKEDVRREPKWNTVTSRWPNRRLTLLNHDDRCDKTRVRKASRIVILKFRLG